MNSHDRRLPPRHRAVALDWLRRLRSTGRATEHAEVLAMARRADPARLEAASLEANRQRLLSLGMLPERVEELMVGWNAEADRRGLTDHPRSPIGYRAPRWHLLS
jgi:hypothetical protein